MKVFTGLVALFGFICGCMDKRTKKKLDRRSTGDDSGLVMAPIGDVKNTQVERFREDTKYTNIEPAKGRYE